MSDRIHFASAGAARKQTRPPVADLTLRDKTLILAAEFKAEARRMDEAFVRRADPRALQGGAIDEEAHRLRSIARTLCNIASAVE
jgi:hypothetical protein